LRKRDQQQIERRLRHVFTSVDKGSREITKGALRVKTPIERLGWLIDFVRSRPSGGYAMLPAVKLRQLSNECRAFTLMQQGSAQRGPDLSGHELDALADELGSVLNRLTRGGQDWDLQVGGGFSHRIVFPRWLQASASRKFARRLGLKPALSTYTGPLKDMVLWSAAELIAENGGSILRCEHPACDKIVVRTGKRRDFCSRRCANLEMTRRLRTKREEEAKRRAQEKKTRLDAAIQRQKGAKNHG
jgi:endogenous inhibitor of DNA gyrase (YacG/DUF329 family)